jgi:hypothetical protein
MYRQTFWGLRALAGTSRRIPPWSPAGGGSVVEVLPKDVGRMIGVPAKVTEQDRRAAVVALTRLRIDLNGYQQTIIEDREGDALDAVYAAVAAACARAQGFEGAPRQAAASGEGWIYSV